MSEIEKEINFLIKIIIKQKKLQFYTNEPEFNTQLFENDILKKEGDKVSINSFKSIAPFFVLKYKEEVNFTTNENFSLTAKFINLVEEHFKSNGYVHDYFMLEKEIWKILIKESNLEYGCNFTDYLKEGNSEGIFDFIEAYSDLLPELNLTVDEIFENTTFLLDVTKNDVNNIVPLDSVLLGIKNKCREDYDFGLNLLNKTLTLSEDRDNLISAIVCGLYENKRNDFYETVLKELISKEENTNAILFGLASVTNINGSDCDLFIELINKFKNNEPLLIPYLSLVFSILKSDNKQHYDRCSEELLSAIENEKSAYYILHNINFIKNWSDKKTAIVIKLINQSYFTIEKYITPISQFFWYEKDFDSFKTIILSIIEVKPFEKFTKKFQSYFHTIEKSLLDDFIISLMTDNSASKRFTGLDIFDGLSNLIPYSFSFNILELSTLSQYKLWVSMCQDFHQPQNRLVALLPLIDSKSELVKESFICKLEEISEDYGGQITDILTNNLDTIKYTDIIERVKKYLSDFYEKNTRVKNSIKEFNPYDTDYKHIKHFNDVFHKNMSKSIDKGARENSLFSILGTDTVQLSKGGGWRFGAKKEISQLGTFGSSFTMPRSYFINPNKYEMEIGFMMRQDWKDEEFLTIKTLLDNE